MTTTEIGLPKPNEIDRRGSVLTWIVTILACAYICWIGISLYYSTTIFINMYTSMGVELPLALRIFIAGYRWMYPILFGGIAALVITKQFFVRDKWFSVSLTLAAAVAVSLIGYGIARTLYQPMFDLMEKLNK